MKLVSDWKQVLRYAWSIRLSLLAGLLSGVEVLLNFTDFGLPSGIFVTLAFIVTLLSTVARIIAQEKI